MESRLDARSLPAAWRGEEGRLVVPAGAAAAAGQRASLEMTGVGDAPLWVNGVVAEARRAPAGWELEVKVDDEGRALVARLLGWIQGAGERPRARAPRLQVSLPAVVSGHSGAIYMTAYSLSRGGCGLAWSGAAPRIGDALWVRLGSGTVAVSMRGMVCWTREGQGGKKVGLRFVGGQQSELSELLSRVKRGL